MLWNTLKQRFWLAVELKLVLSRGTQRHAVDTTLRRLAVHHGPRCCTAHLLEEPSPLLCASKMSLTMWQHLLLINSDLSSSASNSLSSCFIFFCCQVSSHTLPIQLTTYITSSPYKRLAVMEALWCFVTILCVKFYGFSPTYFPADTVHVKTLSI